MPLRDLDASLADHYHATWFDYVDASGRRFVARPVDDPPPAAAPWDLPEVFVVVTAWNPASIAPRGVEDNHAANARLRDDLEARGAAVRPIVGRSADGTWQEPSFAVWNLPVDEASRLAAAHGQHAIFVVDGGRRTLGHAGSRVDTGRATWLVVTIA